MCLRSAHSECLGRVGELVSIATFKQDSYSRCWPPINWVCMLFHWYEQQPCILQRLWGNILLNLKSSSLQIRFAHKCYGLIGLGEETQSWSVNSIILVIFAFLKDL